MNKNPLDTYLEEYEKVSADKPNITHAVVMLNHLMLDEPLQINIKHYKLYPKAMQLADILGIPRQSFTEKLSKAYKSSHAAESAIKTATDNSSALSKDIVKRFSSNLALFPVDTEELAPY